MNPEEPRPQNHLNELPDDSPAVKAAVAELRRRAKRENPQPWSIALSDASLVRFLRARDFEHDLAWKVQGAREAARSSRLTGGGGRASASAGSGGKRLPSASRGSQARWVAAAAALTLHAFLDREPPQPSVRSALACAESEGAGELWHFQSCLPMPRSDFSWCGTVLAKYLRSCRAHLGCRSPPW